MQAGRKRSHAIASAPPRPPLYCAPSRSRCGGTGRRVGLKIRFWQQSVGSIPSTGTMSAIKNVKSRDDR